MILVGSNGVSFSKPYCASTVHLKLRRSGKEDVYRQEVQPAGDPALRLPAERCLAGQRAQGVPWPEVAAAVAASRVPFVGGS
jgi:hypothetical protein